MISITQSFAQYFCNYLTIVAQPFQGIFLLIFLFLHYAQFYILYFVHNSRHFLRYSNCYAIFTQNPLTGGQKPVRMNKTHPKSGELHGRYHQRHRCPGRSLPFHGLPRMQRQPLHQQRDQRQGAQSHGGTGL